MKRNNKVSAQEKNSNLSANTHTNVMDTLNMNPKPYAYCKICGAPIYSPMEAHNGSPAVNGLVCEACNIEHVIPARRALEAIPGAKFDQPILKGRNHSKDFEISFHFNVGNRIHGFKQSLLFNPMDMTDEQVEWYLAKVCRVPVVNGWWIEQCGKILREKRYSEPHLIEA